MLHTGTARIWQSTAHLALCPCLVCTAVPPMYHESAAPAASMCLRLAGLDAQQAVPAHPHDVSRTTTHETRRDRTGQSVLSGSSRFSAHKWPANKQSTPRGWQQKSVGMTS